MSTTPTTATSSAMSLNSLLNSLHSHLQTQTQLLPTLHAQLGLPPTALEDELKELQDQLIHGVEKQIDLRRRQVDEWMVKCEAVETVCLRYTKALGGNVKSTGMTLGELRKEQSLPTRYELVTEYQEKLRQAYHAKLEQLTTITNRLNVLARTLGSSYFAADILEPTPAPAVDDSDAMDALDTNVPRDVTPERFLKLEKELVRGKAEVAKRLQLLFNVFAEIDYLYCELGMAPAYEVTETDEIIPSYSTFALGASTNQQRTLSSSITSDPFLVSTPTPASRGNSTASMLFQSEASSYTPESEEQYKRIFATFVARVEQADDETLQSNPTFGLENVEPTQGLIDWALALQASLEGTKKKREDYIQVMYNQLEDLWKRLEVDLADMDAFVNRHRGSSEESIKNYEEELERMLVLKTERIEQVIGNVRQEIVQLWDDLMIGEDERADFAPFADDEFTDELLALHEHESKKLQEEKKAKAPLLASIKKYFKICEEEKELAAASSDQTRLLGRGRDPGRLLREEKMRKRVQKEKPRLEQDLLAALPQWEQETGMSFLVYGESMLQALMETVSQQEQENKSRSSRSTRSGSVPPRATTPSASTSSNNNYAPGRPGTVTPAVRPRSAASSNSTSTQSVPNKRQRLASSSSSTGAMGASSGQARVPLGAHRGLNHAPARPASPTKIPTKTPGKMVPKPVGSVGSHAALGHGRMPTTAARATRSTSGALSRSNTMSNMAAKRFPSAGHTLEPSYTGGRAGAKLGMDIMKKASRAKRESFRPRPSLDRVEVKTASYGGFGASVKEEDED